MAVEMVMRGERGEFASLDLLGHDVGGAAGGDAAGRRGGVEVVEGKVADGSAARGMDVDCGVLVATATFLKRRSHAQGEEGVWLGFGGENAKRERIRKCCVVWV